MVVVIFGGRSCEHDVSIVTGLLALNSLKKATPVYMDREGVFWCGDRLRDIDAYKPFKNKGLTRVHFMTGDDGVYNDKGKRLFKAEAAVVCCHGAFGEDGCLQGLLELTDIPYTCSGVLAAAAGMDKGVMKSLFESAGLPCVKHIEVTRAEFESEKYDFVERLKTEFEMPLIVKPANLGSSIGIGVAHDYGELFDKMRVAFGFDNRVIIEQALENFTEVNCAVLGAFDGDTEVSLTEQPTLWTEFLSYEDKYLGKGKEGERRKMPAPVSPELIEKIETLAVEAFRAVHAGGVARVDFLVKGDDVYVNEINTVPGSLAYYLFEDKYSMKELVERLIELAAEYKRAKNALTYTYAAAPVTSAKK